jgi:hypothetical protein
MIPGYYDIPNANAELLKQKYGLAYMEEQYLFMVTNSAHQFKQPWY